MQGRLRGKAWILWKIHQKSLAFRNSRKAIIRTLSEHQNPMRRLLNRNDDPNPPPLGGVGSSFRLNRKGIESALLEVSTSNFSQPARADGQAVWYDYLAAYSKS